MELPTQELEALTAPIDPEHPTGESLRYEGTYDRIQEARREDDPRLSQGVWQTSLKKADWEDVQRVCLETLKNRSKDLQIAVWLMESWMMLYGFEGVRLGLEVIDILCDTYWDDLYPELQEDDPEYRLSPFYWVNKTLAIKLKQVPITSPQGFDSEPYSWCDLEDARKLENEGRKNQKVLEDAARDNKVTVAKFENSAILTSEEYFQKLHTSARASLDVLARLNGSLDEKCNKHAPSLQQFHDVLEKVRAVAADFLTQRGVQLSSGGEGRSGSSEDAAEAGGEDEAQGASGSLNVGNIRSRADAYNMLSTIAEYLIRVEPHSPTPYLIKRAVTWGSMPLATLLQELVEGRSDLSSIYKLLGIKEWEE